MLVRKYRSVEDMPQAALRAPLDPHNLKLACELSAVAARLAPGSFSPVQTEIVVQDDHAWGFAGVHGPFPRSRAEPGIRRREFEPIGAFPYRG